MGLRKSAVRTTVQLVELLKERYPTISWDKMFMKGRFGQQRRLEQAISTLFPVSPSHPRFINASMYLQMNHD